MHETTRIWTITKEAFHLYPVAFFGLIWFAQGAFNLILGFILSYRLNHLFDPKLKKYTEQFTDWVPSFTDRYLRTNFYAGWVAKKEWFGRNRPEVQAVDFRANISPQTLRLCWIYTINTHCMLLEMLVLAALVWTGVVKKHA